MNTARMDSLLHRQKQNLVIDVVYALVVATALVIYMIALGIGTSPRTSQVPSQVPAAAPAQALVSVHAAPADCTTPC